MKRILSLILALVLCLSLCACGKSEATKAVEAQIEELTNVTYQDKDKVAAARLAYRNLSTEEQDDVKNIAILVQAETVIAEEELKLIDSIVADYDPYEAIPLLRQIENNAYAQSQISALGVKLLQNYILETGYQSDYRGRPDAEDDYKAVSVDDYPDTFYFVTNPEFASVTFVYRDESAVNRLLKSQYSVDRRDHALMIFGDGGSYSKTEWIDEGWRYAGYATWYVSFNSHSDLDNLSPDIESGNVLFWPYSDSEEDLEKYSKLNVEDYIKQMNQCVSALKIPVTGWELLGFFSHSVTSNEITSTDETTPEVIYYPDTQFPTIESVIEKINSEPTVTQEDLCVRYRYIHKNPQLNDYYNINGEYQNFSKSYKDDVLSQFDQKEYVHKISDKISYSYTVWFDGAGHALMVEGKLTESIWDGNCYNLDICIFSEDNVQVYVDTLD